MNIKKQKKQKNPNTSNLKVVATYSQQELEKEFANVYGTSGSVDLF